MIACYDLARCPPTYDVVAFLALAEQERIRRAEECIDIRILPGPAGGFRRDTLWPRTIEERQQMLDRVLIPLCRLLPSVTSVEVMAIREAWLLDRWGAGAYYVGLPKIVEALKAGSRPLRSTSGASARSVVPARRLITFTLREAAHHPLRNSQTEDWVKAAKILVARGWRVIVIRDTRLAHLELDCEQVPATLSLSWRAAFYSTAALNVGISNGPMWMSIFMNAPTLMLRPTTNAAQGCYDDAFYARCGIKRGEQLPTSPAHQRLVWEEDTCDSIVRAVEEMMEVVA